MRPPNLTEASGLERALDRLGLQDPRNPFLTRQYLKARSTLGESVVMVGAGSDAPSTYGLQQTDWRGRRVLEVPSVPVVGAEHPAWGQVMEAAAARRIARVQLSSYGAIGARLPPAMAFERRWNRAEHVLELAIDDLMAPCHRTHRQRIRQAGRSGCTAVWSSDEEAIRDHGRLLAASVARRGGESGAVSEAIGALHRTLVQADAGRLAQARLGGEVVASALVLLAPLGGYLHSSGNTDGGRSVGAPHFLVYEIATQLKREGRSILNLGGTRDEELGLKTFKNHFGAVEVAAEAGAIDTQGVAGRLGSAAWEALARLKRLSGR